MQEIVCTVGLPQNDGVLLAVTISICCNSQYVATTSNNRTRNTSMDVFLE